MNSSCQLDQGRTGQQTEESFHEEGEVAVAKAAKAGNHLQILSTVTTSSVEEVTEARGAPVWYQLYATNKWDVSKALVLRAEKAGCPVVAITVDRSGGRNQETLFRLQPTDTRDCSGCHERGSLATNMKRRSMFEGVDLSGLKNTQSSAMTWDFIKRMRDTTKMKIVLKGILAYEDAAMAADAKVDGIIVSNHGGRSEDSERSTIDALPEIAEAVKGRMPISDRQRDSAAAPTIVKALCMVRPRSALGRPYIWEPGCVRPARRRARAPELVRVELYGAMQQVGAPTIKHLVPVMVRRA